MTTDQQPATRLAQADRKSVFDSSSAISTGLLTDHYELTMLRSALHCGVAHRRAVFEMFARQLPNGRR